MTRTIFIAAALALAVLPAVPAHAQSPRTFVSAAGNDSNPCSFAAPCRHFQAAVNATSLGGEVDALDPAGYGPIIISQAITINGQGWSYIAPPASGNGITINAVSGNVFIHGVSLNGVGITGGTNAIVFNSGGSLTVTDCVAQNFAFNSGNIVTGHGILMHPTSGAIKFVITNTIVSNNGFNGIYYLPASGSTATATGVIDHVVATNNQGGIAITTSLGSGSTTAAISNSVASNNGSSGIGVENNSAALAVSIDNTSISGNQTGIAALGTPIVTLGRSVVTANTTGIDNNTTSTFFSYQDNRINGNGTDIGGTALNTHALQ